MTEARSCAWREPPQLYDEVPAAGLPAVAVGRHVNLHLGKGLRLLAPAAPPLHALQLEAELLGCKALALLVEGGLLQTS